MSGKKSAQKFPGCKRHIQVTPEAKDRQRLEKEAHVAELCKLFDPKNIGAQSLSVLAGAAIEVRTKCKVVVPVRVHCHMTNLFNNALFAQKMWTDIAKSLRVYSLEGYLDNE